jgi:predicted nucleotidyltransferase
MATPPDPEPSTMPTSLAEALRILKDHEPELRRRGVMHAAVFGSVARGEAGTASDVDIVIDLDPEQPIGLFDYVNIKLHIAAMFGVDTLDGPVDVVNRKMLKPLLRRQILGEAVNAF